MVDTDGDGFRELPNGEKITLNIQFAIQGIPLQVVELVANDRSEVGVKTTVKEVTPDEYRSAQSANLLDVGAWGQSAPPVITLGANERWVPPSSAYFGHRTGVLWAEWVESGGGAGAEPPDYVKQMIDDIGAFQSAPIGSASSRRWVSGWSRT
ncbi:MAG: hypothetical protein OXI81_17565 [Paracoccaceae bacterium]|nr:hypothetical protein [Paracoccaceae bacterium]